MAEDQAKPRADRITIFPLMNKDGMPEIAEKLYMVAPDLYVPVRRQAIHRQTLCMDEAGTPFYHRSMEKR